MIDFDFYEKCNYLLYTFDRPGRINESIDGKQDFKNQSLNALTMTKSIEALINK